MQFTDRIRTIERRASELRISMRQLCLRCGVDYSLIHRWRNGDVVPKVDTVERHLGRIEVELGAVAAELIAAARAVPSGQRPAA